MKEIPAKFDLPYLSDGVIGRRIIAWAIDAVLGGVMSAVVSLGLILMGFLTFGLSWHFLGGIWLVPIMYTFLCVGYGGGATLGQNFAGLTVLRDEDFGPASPAQALVYALGFWVTLAIGSPLLLVALVTRRSRCLHDIACGVVVARVDSWPVMKF